MESGAGLAAGFSDAAYSEAGVTVVPSAADLWSQADVVAKIRPPETSEVELARQGQILISFLYPAQNAELLDTLKAKGVTALATPGTFVTFQGAVLAIDLAVWAWVHIVLGALDGIWMPSARDGTASNGSGSSRSPSHAATTGAHARA